MTRFSIVIVTWNSEKTLWNCVSSLCSNIPEQDFELFIVDNNSRDKRYLDLHQNKPNVKVIKNPENLGYAKAVNIAWRNASGNFFLVLNPDIIFLSNPLPRLILEMQENPEIGAIAPLLHDAEGRPQITGYYPNFPTTAQYFLTRTVLAEKVALLRRVADRFFHSRIGNAGLYHVDQIPGAFLFFRRDLFGGLPPLDEGYFIWMEDVDFCLRVHEKGLKVAVVADEKVIHLGGASFKMRTPSWNRMVFFQSYLTYVSMHFKRGNYVIHAALMFADSFVRIIVILLSGFIRRQGKIGPRMILEWKIMKSILIHSFTRSSPPQKSPRAAQPPDTGIAD